MPRGIDTVYDKEWYSAYTGSEPVQYWNNVGYDRLFLTVYPDKKPEPKDERPKQDNLLRAPLEQKHQRGPKRIDFWFHSIPRKPVRKLKLP